MVMHSPAPAIGVCYYSEHWPSETWPDNAARFALFARAVCAVAMNQAGLDWKPDLVHCNDWQTGLVPALLTLEEERPTTVFTIHNLAYQGLFSWNQFIALQGDGNAEPALDNAEESAQIQALIDLVEAALPEGSLSPH